MLEHEITWSNLISEMTEINHLAAANSKYMERTEPGPGASEQTLLDTEKRLGLHLDPQYRQFLSHADGWPQWNGHSTLLGTKQMGTSEQIFPSGLPWSEVIAGLHSYIAEVDDDWGTYPTPATELLIPVATTRDDFGGRGPSSQAPWRVSGLGVTDGRIAP